MVRPRDNKAFTKLNVKLGSGHASINDQCLFYDQFWNVWHERWRGLLSFVYHFDEKSRSKLIIWALERYVGPSSGRKAFDLGCGRGRLASMLHRRGWVTGGMDLSQAVISQISKKNPGIQFFAGDMFADQSFAKEQYDLVISSEVMEHIQINQREAYALLVNNLLKNNGIAIITTPNMLEMRRLGWSAEQPLDFWMTPTELESYFKKNFDILTFCTTSYCLKNPLVNRLWKCIPFVNSIADTKIAKTYRGKYQMIVLRKKST